MKEPIPDKSERYRIVGEVLADTGARIGLPINDDEVIRWGEVSSRIAAPDDQFEQDPGSISTASLLNTLGLDCDDEQLQATASGLLYVSKAAMEAPTVTEHLDYRELEGEHSFGLLWHSFIDAPTDAHKTEQLRKLAVAGVLLDTILDAPDDRDELPQLSTVGLMAKGAARFTECSKHIETTTWIALLKASKGRDIAPRAAYKVRTLPRRLVSSLG